MSYIRPCRQFGELDVVLETLVVVGAETDVYEQGKPERFEVDITPRRFDSDSSKRSTGTLA